MDQRAVQQLLLQQIQASAGDTSGQAAVPQPELNNLALQARHWAVAQQRKQEYDEHQRQQQVQWEAQRQRQEQQHQMQLQQQQQQQQQFQHQRRNSQNHGGAWPNHEHHQEPQFAPQRFNSNQLARPPRHHNPMPPARLNFQNHQNQQRFQNTPRFQQNSYHPRQKTPTPRRSSNNHIRALPPKAPPPPDLTENPELAKNLPKWMQEEIARIQSTKPVEELKEAEAHNNEDLQKLADEDSDDVAEEEEVEDWKEEVRKLSKDNQESDPELSDSEEVLIRKLSPDKIQAIKTDLLRSSLQNVLLSVTDDFIGKICRNALSRASSGQNTAKTENSGGLGGLIGYGSGSSDDSDDEDQSNKDNDSDWSVDSEKIRKKRKIFDREQRKRLKQFNIGSEDSSSTEDESQERFLAA